MQTLVVVQVLLANTDYPAEGTQAYTDRITSDANDIKTHITAYINAQTTHNTLPTVATIPEAVAQPARKLEF